ncbi:MULTISPECIES: hypothetical protein [unclassified Saccharicrinis]|uniref:hypothetical protein n=1 Tax=unclassified Saccharicrinis TaxID=2646859 RepID=UPI003D33A148
MKNRKNSGPQKDALRGNLKIEGGQIPLSKANHLNQKSKKNSVSAQDGNLFIVPWQRYT